MRRCSTAVCALALTLALALASLAELPLAIAAQRASAAGSDQVKFRPPAIPIVTLDPSFHAYILGDDVTSAPTQSWYESMRELHGMLRVDGEAFRFLGACTVTPAARCPRALRQLSVDVGTVATTVVLEAPRPVPVPETSKTPSETPSDSGSESDSESDSESRSGSAPASVRLTLRILNTPFTDSPKLLSRPVAYVVHDVEALDGAAHDVELYLDATAEHCVSDANETVQARTWASAALRGAKVGTTAQPVLSRGGDRWNPNWGYMHVAASAAYPDARALAGRAGAMRAAFHEDGMRGASRSARGARGRAGTGSDAAKIAVGVARKLGRVKPGKPVRHVVLVGYDDVFAVYYYGARFKGLWTRHYASFEEALAASEREADSALDRAARHDAAETAAATAAGGPLYASVVRLAYRQVLAAIKLVWNDDLGKQWAFLKEISTNGDLNTVDVVFPASPMLLHHSPELLRQMLEPLLDYSNNGTAKPYSNPWSPHELGTYPIANHSTAQQERMEMENTGNMFLMILGVLQRQSPRLGQSAAAAWLEPYFPLLTSWAAYLQASLPFPQRQLCTDDFKGPLANNTNLAAKGIIALEAFADICRALRPASALAAGVGGSAEASDSGSGDSGSGECAAYSQAARDFAEQWKRFALEDGHTKLAYDAPGTYSLPYNLVWQRLLRLGDAPFADFASLAQAQVAFHVAKGRATRFGPPMDSRDANVKTDWLSWGAALASSDADFRALFDPVFRMANETATRVPLIDLFDSATAERPPNVGFTARPVVGAIYAKMLLAGAGAGAGVWPGPGASGGASTGADGGPVHVEGEDDVVLALA